MCPYISIAQYLARSSHMHILELNFERSWRGGERQTLYNMQGFRQLGVTVHLLCRKGYPLQQQAEADGFTCFGFHNIFGVLWFLMTKAQRYDVLHIQASQILTYAVLTLPFHRRKLVFTRRVDFVPHGFFTRLKYRTTHQLVAISTAVQRIVETFSGKKGVVISDIVVPEVLNNERATAFLQQQGIAGKKIIATTAALVPHKDPLTMVAAIKALYTMRQDFVFLHFGSGELETEVRAAIQQHSLQEMYLLPGFVDKATDFFSVMDVFVMSSQEEGLGSSVLDAFIYKVPVVSTTAGGLQDLVEDGRSIACAIKDARALAAGIDTALNADTSAMTDKAYTYAVTHHSMQAITKQYMQLFQSAY